MTTFSTNCTLTAKNIRRVGKRKPRRGDWRVLRQTAMVGPETIIHPSGEGNKRPLGHSLVRPQGSCRPRPILHVLPYGPVLPIFWTLPNVRSMSIDRRKTVLQRRTGGPVPAARTLVWLTALASLTVRRTTGKETEDNEVCMVDLIGGRPRGGGDRLRASRDVRRLHDGQLCHSSRDLCSVRAGRRLLGGRLSGRRRRCSRHGWCPDRLDAVPLLHHTGPT